MTTIALGIQHLNKPLGVGIPQYIHRALAAEFVEVKREQFEKFVEGVNFRRDLIGGIRKYHLVQDHCLWPVKDALGMIFDGNIVAFYVEELGRFFIEPTGRGVKHL